MRTQPYVPFYAAVRALEPTDAGVTRVLQRSARRRRMRVVAFAVAGGERLYAYGVRRTNAAWWRSLLSRHAIAVFVRPADNGRCCPLGRG